MSPDIPHEPEPRSRARQELLGSARRVDRLASVLTLAAFAAQHPERLSQARFSVFGVRQVPRIEPGGSGVLVLLGAGGNRTAEELERFLAECRVSLRGPEGLLVADGSLDPLSDLAAAAQREILVDGAGVLTAELRLPGLAPACYVTATRPGQLTVLAAVAEADGTVDVRQTIFPPPSRSLRFDAGERRLHNWELAQSIHAAGGTSRAWEVISRDADDDPSHDPLRVSLAGYSLLRAENLPIAGPFVRRLLDAIPDFPDVQVLAGLCSRPEERGQYFAKALELGLPVFSEGLRLLAEHFPERPPHLAETLAGLIPGSPWTAWLAPPASVASNR